MWSGVNIVFVTALSVTAFQQLSSLSILGMPSSYAVSAPDDDCFPPCLNGGICHPDEKRCICTNGYDGRDCSTLTDPCSTSPCAEEEDCINNRFHVKGYRCVKNPCCLNSCQDGEQCVIDPRSPGGYYCDADPCRRQTCYNEGTCVYNATVNRCEVSISCICTPPYDPSSMCYFLRGCHPTLRPCQNGGNCTDDFACNCTSGYEGFLCERKVTILSF